MRSADDHVRVCSRSSCSKPALTLVDVLSMLLDEFPEDAFPGEEPAEVLVEMLTGTLRPVAGAAGQHAIPEATALLPATRDRALADLRAAAEQASRR